MPVSWFAACMRIVILVEGRGVDTQNHVVHLFRAEAWEPAFTRAIELGRTHETDYLNGEGARVRWRLDRVLTLDILDVTQDFDGLEVYSEMTDLDLDYDFDNHFIPENHRPGTSGV